MGSGRPKTDCTQASCGGSYLVPGGQSWNQHVTGINCVWISQREDKVKQKNKTRLKKSYMINIPQKTLRKWFSRTSRKSLLRLLVIARMIECTEEGRKTFLSSDCVIDFTVYKESDGLCRSVLACRKSGYMLLILKASSDRFISYLIVDYPETAYVYTVTRSLCFNMISHPSHLTQYLEDAKINECNK